MAFDYGINDPADGAIISQHPTDERAVRKAVRDSAIVEHDAEGGGRHKISVGNNATRNLILDWVVGSIYINTESGDGMLEFAESIDPDVFKPLSGIPTGTNMVFVQSAAPAGWTFDATQNDRVLRVTSTEANGGAVGGSWTLSGVTVDGHVLLTDEMPAHTHTQNSNASTTSLASGGASNITVGITTIASGSTGGDGSHTHGLTSDAVWRPSYQDVIVCAKD